jgi:hypothetical protein
MPVNPSNGLQKGGAGAKARGKVSEPGRFANA